MHQLVLFVEIVSSTRTLVLCRVTIELTTLEETTWRKLIVGRVVEPLHYNFSVCALKNRVVLFGVSGRNIKPMNEPTTMSYM